MISLSFEVAGRHCHEPGQIHCYGPIYQSSWHNRQSGWQFCRLPPLNENTGSVVHKIKISIIVRVNDKISIYSKPVLNGHSQKGQFFFSRPIIA